MDTHEILECTPNPSGSQSPILNVKILAKVGKRKKAKEVTGCGVFAWMRMEQSFRVS